MSGFPVVGDGFVADVDVDGQHLRLFSEIYELGHRAVVYDVNAKNEIARHDADSLEGGKRMAEESAANYLKYVHGITPLPAVNWQMNAKNEIARHDADSLEGGKRMAEESAANYLKYVHGITPLPAVNWQMNAQTQQKQ